ncbi:EamA family transporter [Pandoraea aquatica]|uniref:EamA family transporter n=1 Tax=Pandoraea aquatica TaxID=2508290 RepID=A0A5E4YF74_9BURK|nr:DMT family transporter [Pandoraea aquatica]VVE47371.1 EamA family transporter [Pandoraea aquatica]
MTVAGNGAGGPESAPGVTSTSFSTRAAPALAILIGSSVWGLAWFPYRVLAQWGVAAVPAQICTATVAILLLSLVYRRSLGTLRWSWLLVGVAFAGGTTNVAFVWGTTHGHVMRVLLLFYLTPVWTALFAHWLLGERVGLRGVGLIALALGGAGLMLWSPELGWPVPNNPGEWAGAIAGAAFALNNVLLRRVSQALPDVPAEMRSWTLYLGCVVGGLLVLPFDGGVQSGQAAVSALTSGAATAAVALALGCTIAVTNVIVQFGLARVPANQAALIMLFEIVVAAISSWWLASEGLGVREIAGGLCIVAAGVLSGILPDSRRCKSATAGDAMV